MNNQKYNVAFDKVYIEYTLFKKLLNQLTNATAVEVTMNIVFGWIAPFIGALPGIINSQRGNKDINELVYA